MKKILLIVCVGMVIMLLANASAAEFDNVLNKGNINSVSGYPTLHVNNWFGLGKRLATIDLLENTNYCISNCYAIINFTTYENMALPKIFSFVSGEGVETFPTYKVYYETSKTADIQKTVYKQECVNVKNSTGGNEICSYIKDYDYTEKQTFYGWVEYNGQELPAGSHKIKIEGKKAKRDNLDWAFSFQGISESSIRKEWAWWNNDWTRKINITITEKSGSNYDDLPIKIEIPYDNNMIQNFSDIRFVDSDDTTELDYFQAYTNDSNLSVFWVEVDLTASTSKDIYAYYGISGVDTTSNLDAVNFTYADNFTSWRSGEYTCNSGSPTISGGVAFFGDIGGGNDAVCGEFGKNELFGSRVEINARYNDTAGAWLDLGLKSTTDSTKPRQSPNSVYITKETGGSQEATSRVGGTNHASSSSWSNYDFNFLDIKLNSSSSVIIVNQNEDSTETANAPTGISMGFGGRRGFGLDWIILQQLTDPEPEVLLGEEQVGGINGGVEIYLDSPSDSSHLSASLNSTYFSVNIQSLNASDEIDNATLYVWYANFSLFRTNFSDISGATNLTNLSLSNLGINSFLWNYYACTEYNYCNFSEANYSFLIVADTNQTFLANAYETSKQTFIIDVSVPPAETIYGGTFVYNGTAYSVSNISRIGDTYTLTKRLDLPINPSATQNTTRNFYWAFNYGSNLTQQTTTPQQQNVSNIYLGYCSSTYPLALLNFTGRIENNNSEINLSIGASFQYYLGEGTTYKSYSYSNLNESISRFNFCSVPSSFSQSPLKTDMDLEYSATDYVDRTYYLENAELNPNSTNAITLYTIPTDDAQKFFVDVKDGIDIVTGANVAINKHFVGEGVYKTIGIRQTDSNGEFVEYFDLDKEYLFAVSKDGESLGTITKIVSCQAAPCTLTLQLSDAATDIYEGYYDKFATNIVYNLSFEQNSKIVTFTYIDTSGLAQYARLLVNRMTYNTTQEAVCDNSVYSTAGSITCNVSGKQGDFKATAYISRSPEKVIDYILFYVSSLKESIGLTGIFAALIMIITIVFAFLSGDARLGVLSIVLGLTVLKLIDLLPISWAIISVFWIIALYLATKMGGQTNF